jgi:hypothetical protein
MAYFERHQRFPRSQALWPGSWVGSSPHLGTSWTSPTWIALGFVADDPHFCHYQYDSTNHPTDPNRSTFMASDFGDIDGDDRYSAFVRLGSVRDLEGAWGGGFYIANELE